MNSPTEDTRVPQSAGETTREAEWDRILSASARADAARVPAPTLATPSDVRGLDAEPRWWRPGWRDGLRHVGWRWIFLLPSVLFGLVWLPPLRPLRLALLAAGIQLVGLMVTIALSLAGYVVRRAARARTEPFCIFCGYDLSGLPDGYRCPECGRPYSWRLIAEYRRDPEWFIARYRALRHLPPAPQPFDAGPGPRRRRRDGT